MTKMTKMTKITFKKDYLYVVKTVKCLHISNTSVSTASTAPSVSPTSPTETENYIMIVTNVITEKDRNFPDFPTKTKVIHIAIENIPDGWGRNYVGRTNGWKGEISTETDLSDDSLKIIRTVTEIGSKNEHPEYFL